MATVAPAGRPSSCLPPPPAPAAVPAAQAAFPRYGDPGDEHEESPPSSSAASSSSPSPWGRRCFFFCGVGAFPVFEEEAADTAAAAATLRADLRCCWCGRHGKQEVWTKKIAGKVSIGCGGGGGGRERGGEGGRGGEGEGIWLAEFQDEGSPPPRFVHCFSAATKKTATGNVRPRPSFLVLYLVIVRDTARGSPLFRWTQPSVGCENRRSLAGHLSCCYTHDCNFLRVYPSRHPILAVKNDLEAKEPMRSTFRGPTYRHVVMSSVVISSCRRLRVRTLR